MYNLSWTFRVNNNKKINFKSFTKVNFQHCNRVDNSYRWLLGENVPTYGPFRDMWLPECANDPSKVSETKYYCGSGDNGGVHINSGVISKKFFNFC